MLPKVMGSAASTEVAPKQDSVLHSAIDVRFKNASPNVHCNGASLDAKRAAFSRGLPFVKKVRGINLPPDARRASIPFEREQGGHAVVSDYSSSRTIS